jgi:hypothetical protein
MGEGHTEGPHTTSEYRFLIEILDDIASSCTQRHPGRSLVWAPFPAVL